LTKISSLTEMNGFVKKTIHQNYYQGLLEKF